MDGYQKLIRQHEEFNAWKAYENLMNALQIQRLKRMYPRASQDFFKANETETRTQLPDTAPKSHKTSALDRVATGKAKSLGRVTVRYRLCRVRPLDPDATQGSTKDITDGLCKCGLLQGDDPTQIILTVEQERVEHYSDEGTHVEIEYPEGYFPPRGKNFC